MKPAYTKAHRRIARLRGKATSYACVDCEKPAQEWALDHSGEDPGRVLDPVLNVYYSTDVMRYRPMCRSCHRKYDYLVMRTTCPHGHPYAGHNLIIEGRRRRCRACRNAKQSRRQRLLRQIDPEYGPAQYLRRKVLKQQRDEGAA